MLTLACHERPFVRRLPGSAVQFQRRHFNQGVSHRVSGRYAPWRYCASARRITSDTLIPSACARCSASDFNDAPRRTDSTDFLSPPRRGRPRPRGAHVLAIVMEWSTEVVNHDESELAFILAKESRQIGPGLKTAVGD